MRRTCHSSAWSLLLRACQHTNISHTNATPAPRYYFDMNVCLEPFTVPTNHFLYEKLLKNCYKREHISYDHWHTNLLHTNFNPLWIFSLTNLSIPTVHIRALSVMNFLNTNLIHYELLNYEFLPLQTFYSTNTIPYEYLHANPCLRTFSHTNLVFTNFRPFTGRGLPLTSLRSHWDQKERDRWNLACLLLVEVKHRVNWWVYTYKENNAFGSF